MTSGDVGEERLETDYLIVGAGAMGMAFADVIYKEQPSATITLVDKRARPGGHWNSAYPFVALHQPAAFYGLNSARLGTGGADLASGAEILGYYHRAMQKMLKSGRVCFMGQCEHQGDGKLVSLLDEQQVTRVNAKKRLVDAGYMTVKVPSTHKPRYEVDEAITIVPPNALPEIREPWSRYVIIGAGKTAMDAILFLLAQRITPDRIQWIVPNDAWLWNRNLIQPGIATAMFMDQLQAVIDHREPDAIFTELEKQGSISRIDQSRMPVKWRCATVDPAEVKALRRIDNVVRLGRVQRITPTEIQLADGAVPTARDSLHVDCTADGLAKLPPKPLFEKDRVTLQSIFMCQQVLSAAILAKMTLLDMSDEGRDALCQIVPHPEFKKDLAPSLVASVDNLLKLTPHMPLWLRRSRLNFMHHESLWNYVAGALKARNRLGKARAAV